MKNKLQPTRTSFSRNFQCKVFSFWYWKSGGPVKKTTLYEGIYGIWLYSMIQCSGIKTSRSIVPFQMVYTVDWMTACIYGVVKVKVEHGNTAKRIVKTSVLIVLFLRNNRTPSNPFFSRNIPHSPAGLAGCQSSKYSIKMHVQSNRTWSEIS